MKKILSVILTILMFLALVACDNTLSGVTNSESNNVENNNGGESTDNGHTDSDDSNLNDEKPICITHNYINNICSDCNCSLWSGDIDTSWYSVVDTEFNISTAEQFAGFAQLVNNGTDFHDTTIQLSADIDLNNKEWVSIGTTSKPFAGVFNGAEHNVSNFVITVDTNENIGLFGYSNGHICKLGVKNAQIDITVANSVYVGGFAGYNLGTIESCYAVSQINSKVTDGALYVGGLVGYNESQIISCYSSITISAINEAVGVYNGLCVVGGLIGKNYVGTIANSYSVGTVYGSSTGDYNDSTFGSCNVGGLVGVSGCADRTKRSIIENCYTTTTVTALAINDDCNAGGLVGTLHKGIEINCSYSTGTVTANSAATQDYKKSYVGGMAGYIYSDYFSSLRKVFIQDCWTISEIKLETSNGNGYAGPIIGNDASWSFANCYNIDENSVIADHLTQGGTPANSNDFKNIAFYQNRMPTWDSKIWNLTDGSYPTLK